MAREMQGEAMQRRMVVALERIATALESLDGRTAGWLEAAERVVEADAMTAQERDQAEQYARLTGAERRREGWAESPYLGRDEEEDPA